MNKEDKKIQEDLVNEMMKVSKTNPDVMIYMQVLMKCYEDLQQENEQLKECYCNRTDCVGRIKDSRKYDSLYQKYEQLKKQKDDVVEYALKLKQNAPDEIMLNNLLRMLGEIDE